MYSVESVRAGENGTSRHKSMDGAFCQLSCLCKPFTITNTDWSGTGWSFILYRFKYWLWIFFFFFALSFSLAFSQHLMQFELECWDNN